MGLGLALIHLRRYATGIFNPSHIVDVGRGEREACPESLYKDAVDTSFFQYNVLRRAILAGVEPLRLDGYDITALYLSFGHVCLCVGAIIAHFDCAVNRET